MTALAARIAAAFVAACRDELDAPKPGNVHVFADGHRMTAAEFVRSARGRGRPADGARRARRAAHSAARSRRRARRSAPTPISELSCSARRLRPRPRRQPRRSARPRLRTCSKASISRTPIWHSAPSRLPRPAGLGHAERHDVRAPATVTLAQAMAEAADRDRIAHQFSAGFADIFDRGLARRDAASRAVGRSEMGDACGLSRISRRLSRQPHRAEIRRRRCRRGAPDRGGISSAGCDPSEPDAACWPICSRGIAPSSSAPSIPAPART